MSVRTVSKKPTVASAVFEDTGDHGITPGMKSHLQQIYQVGTTLTPPTPTYASVVRKSFDLKFADTYKGPPQINDDMPVDGLLDRARRGVNRYRGKADYKYVESSPVGFTSKSTDVEGYVEYTSGFPPFTVLYMPEDGKSVYVTIQPTKTYVFSGRGIHPSFMVDPTSVTGNTLTCSQLDLQTQVFEISNIAPSYKDVINGFNLAYKYFEQERTKRVNPGSFDNGGWNSGSHNEDPPVESQTAPDAPGASDAPGSSRASRKKHW
jgi:hypothetical protein